MRWMCWWSSRFLSPVTSVMEASFMEEDLPAARAIRFNRSIAREGMRPDATRRVDWTMVLLDTISPGCDIDNGERGDLLVGMSLGRSRRLAQRFERGTQLDREEFGLLP